MPDRDLIDREIPQVHWAEQQSKRVEKVIPWEDLDARKNRYNFVDDEGYYTLSPTEDLYGLDDLELSDDEVLRAALRQATSKVEDLTLSKRGGIYENIFPRFTDAPRGTRLNSERLEKILKGLELTELTNLKKLLLVEVLFRREMALSWDFDKIGKIHEEISPPYEIKTIPHNAWQVKSIPVPAPLRELVVEVPKARLKNGLLEEAYSLYRKAWFLVEKRTRGSCDEFSEEYAMCKILFVITTLPQGATNSVAQFLRVLSCVRYDISPQRCEPFFDDVVVRGPVVRYNDQEVAPGVRKFVLEHIKNIDATLLNFELSRIIASAILKSEWCKQTTKIIGYMYGTNGRKPAGAKVLKIQEWPHCKDLKEVIRAFLGVTTYYRIWIVGYATIAHALIILTRKNEPFRFDKPQREAMRLLKEALTTAPVLISLDYAGGAIWLKADASGEGWGAILCQEVGIEVKPSCYESGIWRGPELRYDATKQECLAVVKSLRRVRNYLYSVRFHLETDCQGTYSLTQ
ncbi:hypothetical protein CHU98_g8405 [Xylaria longipes]|nr:hypothetical protein CHU98_g8405 [Xylaria longipes]